jgi:branched-chain amino acid:cation transporter, LIVCS family
MTYKAVVFSAGFATFAMFFGAGNLVFPLAVGAQAGNHLLMGVLGFLLTGVLVPFLGLFAISLYHGDYLEFLAGIGEIPAFLVALLLVVLIGIVVATPRMSVLAYGTFAPFLPKSHLMPVFFNAVFFGLVYLASLKQNKIVDFLGFVLSPIKLATLIIVIVVGLAVGHLPAHLHTAAGAQVWSAMKAGYGTMDLLAAFFFCAFIYKFIQVKTKQDKKATVALDRQLTMVACFIGAGLLAAIYLGFMVVANRHSAGLQGVPTQSMIGMLAKLLLGPFAGIFVAICVGLACFSSALAVTAVTVDFFKTRVLQERLSYKVVLASVVILVFVMSNMGFSMLMAIAIPVLSVLYPALIVLTVTNLLTKLTRFSLGAWPFYLTLLGAVFFVIPK